MGLCFRGLPHCARAYLGLSYAVDAPSEPVNKYQVAVE
jgi:hypothetical protein